MVSLDYTRELNFHARVERLKEVQNGLDQYFDKVYAVSERKPSPTEVLQGFRKNLRSLSDVIQKRLAVRVKKRDPGVSNSREIVEENSDSTKTKEVVFNPLFTIAGLIALRSHAQLNDIAPLLVQLHKFRTVQVSELEKGEVDIWAKLFEGFDHKVKSIGEVYDDCIRFGVADNLANLRQWWMWL